MPCHTGVTDWYNGNARLEKRFTTLQVGEARLIDRAHQTLLRSLLAERMTLAMNATISFSNCFSRRSVPLWAIAYLNSYVPG